MLLSSPVFLAVVIRTALHGETFGAGATVCGAMVLATAALSLASWRRRRDARRQRSREASHLSDRQPG
jgi:hypothetical protein